MSDAAEIVPRVAAPADAATEAVAAAPATPVSTPAATPAAASSLSSLVEGLTSMQRIEQYMPSRVDEGLHVNTVRWVVPKDAKVTAAASTGPAASSSGVAPASDTVEAVPATPSVEAAPGALSGVKAGILFCHGYGHYVGLNYDWLASILARHGIASFAMEHIGHGKSEGLPGYLPNFGAQHAPAALVCSSPASAALFHAYISCPPPPLLSWLCRRRRHGRPELGRHHQGEVPARR